VNWARVRDGFMPWAGLALGTTGFFLAHQIGSDATFQDCRAGSPWIVIVGTIVGLAVIGAGAWGSWGVYSASGEAPARRTIAAIGLMACALFAVGATLPFVAALIIPGCWA
jgi:hypothetical protein